MLEDKRKVYRQWKRYTILIYSTDAEFEKDTLHVAACECTVIGLCSVIANITEP